MVVITCHYQRVTWPSSRNHRLSSFSPSLAAILILVSWLRELSMKSQSFRWYGHFIYFILHFFRRPSWPDEVRRWTTGFDIPTKTSTTSSQLPWTPSFRCNLLQHLHQRSLKHEPAGLVCSTFWRDVLSRSPVENELLAPKMGLDWHILKVNRQMTFF